ncbi:MAG: GNAT family N-acetyltransferase [Gemmatimonadetes bacterium]|nr:GNAT family N-acetyltransferase [Gemmatimonadota bacterium]
MTPAEFRACADLQREVWGERYTEVVPASLLMAAQRLGGVVAGAFDARGLLVGFVFGLTGEDGGVPVHWSDTLAVRPGFQNRQLGTRLKLFQRELLLPRGVTRVQWTFDPLESRNAYLNFARLGVEAREYRADLYGETDSALHEGIGTDRLVASWEIASERVRRRLSGEERSPRGCDLADVPVVNAPRRLPCGLLSGEPDISLNVSRVLITIPADIQGLKALSAELALDWRRKTRAAFMAYLDRGYQVVEFARAGDVGRYLLLRDG